MSASQRRKGRAYEQEVARQLRDVYPDARRGLQSRSGADVPDVDGTPFWVECKRGKRPSVRAALNQAIAATDGRPPLAVIRDDHGQPFVALKLDDFLRLLVERGNPDD